MKRRSIAILSLAALLLPAAALAARKPKEEKAKGEIVSVSADQLSLKTKKGTLTILLTPKSKIVMGRMEMPAAALKPGARVTVAGTAQPNGEIVAREVQLPEPLAAAPPAMPSGHGGHAH